MKIDLGEVSRRVVSDVLQLKNTDCLSVQTWEHMLPLAKEIVKEARRAGADTMMTVDSDDVWYEALTNLPEEWLREPSTLQQAARRVATAEVYVGGPTNPETMKRVSTERWRANEEGAEATYKPFEDEPIPSVDIFLGRVTEQRARNYGFEYEKWYRSVLAALSVDPGVLRKQGERVAKALRGARTGHLTAPGGTDFEFQFQGIEPTVFTGEIRPVKGKKSTYFATLPSGSIGVALKQGTGEGLVVSTTPIPQAGDFVRGLTWEFRGGRISSVDAETHLEYFTMHWEDERRKGADQLGVLTIGLNPEAKYGFLENELVEGAVTMGIGNNEWLGGTNDCDFGFPMSFKDATLEVDGRKLVDSGRIELV